MVQLFTFSSFICDIPSIYMVHFVSYLSFLEFSWSKTRPWAADRKYTVLIGLYSRVLILDNWEVQTSFWIWICQKKTIIFPIIFTFIYDSDTSLTKAMTLIAEVNCCIQFQFGQLVQGWTWSGSDLANLTSCKIRLGLGLDTIRVECHEAVTFETSYRSFNYDNISIIHN